MLSFSDDDIAEYSSLKKNKEIEGFLDKSKLEEPTTTKKKKTKKKNSDSFSALESNNKSFDLVDAYNKKVQPTIVTEEEISSPSEGSFEDWYDFFDRYFEN